MNICNDLIKPLIKPVYYEVQISENRVAVIEIENRINKPYSTIEKATIDAKRKSIQRFFIRHGSATREIIERDHLQRLFQLSSGIHYEIIPVSNATPGNLDQYEIQNYFTTYLTGVDSHDENKDIILENIELLIQTNDEYKPTIAGMLLFGQNRITKFLPQAGISCVSVNGDSLQDDIQDHKYFERDIFTNFDDALSFFGRYNTLTFKIISGHRQNKLDYPVNSVREILANAFIHRDYTISGSQIRMHVFNDRIEIISPGGLPNTITPEKMLYGSKYHRNPILVQYLYDAGIVERLGQGIPKTNKWLKENGNPPLKIDVDEHEVKVVLFRGL